MISSTVFFGLFGVGLTFLPEEIAGYLNMGTNPISMLMLQILGSLYLGFGMLNWMTKNNIIGGIYGRPLVMGNFLHFLVSFFAILKITLKNGANFEIILPLNLIYLVFVVCFGYLLMFNPSMLSKVK